MKAQSKTLFLLVAVIFSTTACGKVSGSIGGRKNRIPIALLEKGAGAGIISSSDQSSVTGSGYRVQSSVGSSYDKLQATTSGGYKVQMNIQGEIFE